jgi:hypothetical protein
MGGAGGFSRSLTFSSLTGKGIRDAAKIQEQVKSTNSLITLQEKYLLYLT